MENKPLSKKSIIRLSTFSLIFLAFMLYSFSGSGSANLSTVEQHVYPGQQGFLRTSVGSTTNLAISKDAYDLYFKAISAKDEVGYYQLLNTGKIFNVPNGTKVLVIDVSGGYDEVRFVEGAHIGETAWVSYEFIKSN